MPETLGAFLARHPDIERVEAFTTDVNGIARGKWLPRDKAVEIAEKGLPLPRSIHALDIRGHDVEAAGLAFGTGDPDGLCRPVPGTAALVPWAERSTAQVLVTMEDADGSPWFAEPRAMLGRVVGRLKDKGLRAVVATELEFYLLDPRHPAATANDGAQVLSLDFLSVNERLFNEIEAACRLQNVPIETMLRENGPGQYELNLRHVADPLMAADHAILLKRIVRHVASRHDRLATFMAKPFGTQSGSGMHVHVSLLDSGGAPVFTSASHRSHAVGGLISTMAEAMLLFAPHANSYRRFRRASHAPMTAGWGDDDRSAAVRVITGSPAATRIEQRVAGADCNPYLAVAAILAGILHGLENGSDPGPAQSPRDDGLSGRPLPREWGAAIDVFAASDFIADALGSRARDLIVACKRQDQDDLLARVPDTEYAAYLGVL